MTRLRIAALFVAVVSGDYAALMLIDCQLTHFAVAAAICAGSSLAAGLIAYADDEIARRQRELGRNRRKSVPRGRAVRKRTDQQPAVPTQRQCPLCGLARQMRSESAVFADRQGALRCGACASVPTPSQHREPTTGAKPEDGATRTGAIGDGGSHVGASR